MKPLQLDLVPKSGASNSNNVLSQLENVVAANPLRPKHPGEELVPSMDVVLEYVSLIKLWGIFWDTIQLECR